MASRYPSTLDGTDNLPTLRNGLTNADASVFNNLRDSILAVERTLGINPQGNFADLASRLSVVVNVDGSLNKNAFQAIGGVFGPINNDDIDQNAAISESKLNLNFPTSLLYDTIKIVDAQSAGLINQILATNATLQDHITRAIGAHRSAAIAMDAQTAAVQSTTATTKIDAGNVQSVIQNLYSQHINFSPGVNSAGLSLTNSPHQANQIFYDNRNTELPTNSVQGAIDNIFADGTAAITDHQRQLHSNGIQRRVEATDTQNASGIERGRILLSAFTGILQYPNSNSDTSLFINIPIQIGATNTGVSLVLLNTDGTSEAIPIDVDDSLQITDPLGTQYALLPISDLRVVPTTDPSTNQTTNYLVGIEVFYNPVVFSSLFSANGITDNNPTLQITGSVYKKVDVQGNANGLNCIARVLKANSASDANLSSFVSEIQVAHPNAATIISQGFNESALARRADGYFDRNFASTLTLVVDGINTYQVVIVPNSPVDITLDTCVAKANLGFLQQNIPITAYILGEEMALAHNWPDDIFIAGVSHTIRIISGGGVDASTAAGFAYVANTTVYGSAGNSFIVNGVQRSTFRIKLPLENTSALGKSGFAIFGNVVVFNDASNNPLAAGVRVGDIVNIQGLTSVSVAGVLDGSRRISNLTSDTLTVDGNPYPTDVQLSASATLVVYSNVVSLDNLARRFQSDFIDLDPVLSQNVIVQIFMNSAGELDYHERIIYPNAATISGTPYGGPATLPLTNLTTDDHGVYIIDCNRELVGSATGDTRLVSFQFDNNKRVFATFGCQNAPNDGYALSISLHGPVVNITGDGMYNLIDETGLNYITIQSVQAFNLLSDTILSTIPDGQLLTYVLPIVKFEQINEFENLLLCNVYYNSQVNQIPLLDGDLGVSDKRYTGTLGVEQIRDDVVEMYVSGPMGETRGSGIVGNGLLVPSDPSATSNITNDKVVYVNGGVVYVQGVRYEISSQQIYVDPATLDVSQYGTDGYFPGTGAIPNGNGTFKNGYIIYYVFVDHFGRLQTTSNLNLPASLPFVPLAKVFLTTRGILNNSPNILSVNVVDFRLHIDAIDDKIEIVVGSIDQQTAHFHSILAAVEYVDNLRYNDVVTGNNLHIRPTIIRVLEGVYQEPTTIEIPPYVTIRGESSRSVRIRPPASLLATNIQLSDSANQNRYVFNVNLLPEGISAKIENICFDLNTANTASSANLPGLSNIGAIKVTWFDNSVALINTPAQLINAPSSIEITGCLFLLDGPFKTTGITTVFGTATPLITGGIYKFSYSYSLLYNKIYFSNYTTYNIDHPVPIPGSQAFNPATHPSTLAISAVETNPPAPDGIHSPPNVLDINPPAPFTPEDAIFTDPNAPAGYNHGGSMIISNNTFVITDGYNSIGIDRFYDTTLASGYMSNAPIPVSNTRMSAFKAINNSFRYVNANPSNLITNKITLNTNGIINTTTPVNTNPASGFGPGQESLRDQMYDLMIHRDLRGFAPYMYPNGTLYPDPKDGYGILDGYNVPPAGGKITEFMVISGNTPTGLNIPEATPIRFATETQDSVARDQHGGGTIFGTITVPYTGLPIVLDRSMDWHDRYVFIYGTDVLTNTQDSSLIAAAIKNQIYTSSTPVSQINTSVSFVPDTVISLNMIAQSPDKAMTSYGTNTLGASHGFAYGYTSRLNGELITIRNPAPLQLPGWTQVKYLGTILFSDVNNNISLVVMPNGELAAVHAGKQDPTALSTNANLVQTSDSFPGFPDVNGRPTDGYGGSLGGGTLTVSKTISFVIQYSPKLNVLTTSNISGNNTNNIDNSGGGWGKI
jgi:hypothetical protein